MGAGFRVSLRLLGFQMTPEKRDVGFHSFSLNRRVASPNLARGATCCPFRIQGGVSTYLRIGHPRRAPESPESQILSRHPLRQPDRDWGFLMPDLWTSWLSNAVTPSSKTHCTESHELDHGHR